VREEADRESACNRVVDRVVDRVDDREAMR
jgi:hypothetical protein